MDLRTSRRLLIRLSLLPVALIGGLAAYAGVSPATAAIFRDLSVLLTSLTAAFQHNGPALLAFAAGVAITMLVLSRSLRDTGQTHTRQSDLSCLRQESLRMAYAIVRHLPNGQVFVLDREKRYVFIEGQLAHDDPGLRQDSMIGRTIAETYPCETRRMLEALVDSALSGTQADRELASRERTYRIFASPLPDADGQIHHCLLFAQDISPLKEDRERLEALNRKLHHQATSDGLLGIANRREFERVLELEWRRAIRERQPLSLLMIDVDNFKTFNDTYGHLKGDECLQQVAATLREITGRPGDLVARYGGEEMAILLPRTGQEGALHIAQRVHASLAERGIPFLDSPVADHVTVSVGVASMLPGQNVSAHALIAHADEGLYAAKDNGRNRTEVIPRLRLIASKDEESGHATLRYLPEEPVSEAGTATSA